MRMNLQEKLSGLRGLVAQAHGRRRLKELTVDMISPPLGDFRHTMHVGRGGDVFGDTSFLSNHGGGGGDTDSAPSTPDNKIGAFFSRTLRQIRRGSDTRPRDNAAKELSPPPPLVSPIIKNAISLPRLDELPNGGVARVLFPNRASPHERDYGVDSGFVTLPRLSRSERQEPSASHLAPVHRGSLTVHRGSLTDVRGSLADPCGSLTDGRGSLTNVHSSLTDPITCSSSSVLLASEPRCTAFSDSLPSLTSLDFTFDLGPSLVSEVLGLLDGGHFEEHSGHFEDQVHAWEEGSACGRTPEDSELDSATVSYVDSLLREESGGGKSPQWEESSGGKSPQWEESGGGKSPKREGSSDGKSPQFEQRRSGKSPQREEQGGRKSPQWDDHQSGKSPKWEELRSVKSPQWEDEDSCGGVVAVKMPDLVVASQERLRMESDRFQNAADVLARHYGVTSTASKGRFRTDAHIDMFSRKKTPYTYIDDDDEIKV